jgi:hypothetical protein
LPELLHPRTARLLQCKAEGGALNTLLELLPIPAEKMEEKYSES